MLLRRTLFSAILLTSMLLLSTTALAQRGRRGTGGPDARLQRAGIHVGMPAPDVEVYYPDGRPVRFPALLKGRYTVIVGACLTCPAFLSTHPEIEAVHRDFAPKGVGFYYYYRALAHPENNTYVKPFTLEERLMHVREAKERLRVQIPFIADNMDNELNQSLGGTPNSDYIFGADGKLVHVSGWSDGPKLRGALTKLVGAVPHPTQVADLNLPPMIQPMRLKATGVVPRIEPPEGTLFRPVRVEPQPSEDPFYMKLRAEVTPEVLETGTGKLYLGFHPDPIHRVYWNNLTAPLKFEIQSPAGTVVTPSRAEGPKVETVASDSDPREFLVDVAAKNREAPLELTVRYYACHEKWCRAITQSYEIHLAFDPDAGGVIDRSFRPRPGGNAPGGPGDARFLSRIMTMDADHDGKLSADELPQHLRREVSLMDSDGDGYVDASEIEALKSLAARPRPARKTQRLER